MLKWECLISDAIESDGKNLAEKDYDKMIFSQALRRMARKTQVHPLAINDHVHNRMSHSLEVSVVGRSIVYALNDYKKLDKKIAADILMAAGLGHDFGNPPFGHIGEDAISMWVRENRANLEKVNISDEIIDTYTRFEGNPQNFHLFTSIEYFKKKPLSNSTIATMVKYPRVSCIENEKSGYFRYDEELFSKIFDSLGLKVNNKYVRHPLSYLLEAADDICYAIMDIDDAFEMGIIDGADWELKEIIAKLLGNNFTWDHKNKFRNERGKIIDRAVSEIVQVFDKNYHAIMNGEIEIGVDLFDLAKHKRTLNGIKNLKGVARKQIFGNRRKVKFETSSYNIIKVILDNWLDAYVDYYCNGFNIKKCGNKSIRLFDLFEMKGLNYLSEKNDRAIIQVVDYISCMTDRYAQEQSKVLLGVYE